MWGGFTHRDGASGRLVRDHASDRPPDHEAGETPVEWAFFGVVEGSLSSVVLELEFVPEKGTRDIDGLAPDNGDVLSVHDLLGHVGAERLEHIGLVR